MTDDLHPDLELANALLEDDLSAGERARAEASPDVVALAGMLGELRAELAGVSPAPHGRREQALAAALAEFDELRASEQAATAPAGSGTVLSFFRRRAPILLGAAAAVVLAGIVGITALRGDDADDSVAKVGADTSAAEELSVASADDGEASTEGGSGPDEAREALPINGPASAAYVISSPEELLGIAMIVVGDGVEVAPAGTTLDTGEPKVETSSAWPGFVCPLTPTDVVLAEIVWIDTPAFAVLDTTTGVVSAVDGGCTVLVTATP